MNPKLKKAADTILTYSTTGRAGGAPGVGGKGPPNKKNI